MVATYGGDDWKRLAKERAIPSAEQLGVPAIHVHGETLHEARNGGLALVDTEWVCHLDADDELEAGYFDHMAQGSADVRAPSVRYISPSGAASWPRVPKVSGHHHDCAAECLPYGNWLVVGAMVRTELVRKVGWKDWPVYEDWAFWLECFNAGATFEAIPPAVYRAHERRNSRNRAPAPAMKLATHRAIAAANGAPIP